MKETYEMPEAHRLMNRIIQLRQEGKDCTQEISRLQAIQDACPHQFPVSKAQSNKVRNAICELCFLTARLSPDGSLSPRE